MKAEAGGTTQASNASPFTPSTASSASPPPFAPSSAAAVPPAPGASPFAPSASASSASGPPPFAPSTPTPSPEAANPAVTPPFTPPFAPSKPPAPAPGAAVDTAPSPVADSHVSLCLRDLLSDLPEDVLGFNAARIPEAMKVNLPAEGIVSQVPSGKVSVSLGEIVQSLDPQFRAAFGNGKMDSAVKIPLQEVYAALPGGGATATAKVPQQQQAPPPLAPSSDSAPAPVSSGPSMPFAPSKASNLQAPAASSPSPFAASPIPSEKKEAPPQTLDTAPSLPAAELAATQPALDFSPPPLSPPPAPAAAVEVSAKEEIPDQEQVAIETPVVSEPEKEAAGDRQSIFDADMNDDILKPLKWDPQAKSTTLADETSVASSPLKMPTAPSFDDDESQPLDSLSAPAPPLERSEKPTESEKKPSSVLSPMVPKGPTLLKKQAGEVEESQKSDSKQVETKPVLPNLGAGEKTAAADRSKSSSAAMPSAKDSKKKSSAAPDFVLRALLGMDGTPTCENVVEHCRQLSGVSECLVLRSGEVMPKSNEAGVLASVAEGAFEKVTGLVRDMGISSADALTIQLDSGILNFFVDEAACLAILQDDSAKLGPGVRERLTLISQQLGTIPLA